MTESCHYLVILRFRLSSQVELMELIYYVYNHEPRNVQEREIYEYEVTSQKLILQGS